MFQALINCKTLTMKYLKVTFGENCNSEIPKFHNFLKNSKIQFLELDNLESTDGFDTFEFCDFLKNSQYLQGLSLNYSSMRFKLNRILQALVSNKTVKILYFNRMRLSYFSAELSNLILLSTTISTLVFHEPDWTIDLEFIEAICKAKSLSYLFFVGIDSTPIIHIEDKNAFRLSESNLKGINIDYIEISKEAKEAIYKKIPKIDLPYLNEGLLGFENLLK